MSQQLSPYLLRRINEIIQRGDPGKGKRHFVNPSRLDFTDIPSRDFEDRLDIYSHRCVLNVGKALVMTEQLREHAVNSEIVGSRSLVTGGGAVWQLFRGDTDRPACHTLPGQLWYGGQLPTIVGTNPALQRHSVLLFGDVMLMDKAVNRVDQFFDHSEIRLEVLVAAASEVFKGNRSPSEAHELYRKTMRQFNDEMLKSPTWMSNSSSCDLILPGVPDLGEATGEADAGTAQSVILASSDALDQPVDRELDEFKEQLCDEARSEETDGSDA